MAKPKRIAAAKARASFKGLLADVRRTGGRVQITRYGRAAAWLVPVEDGRALEDCADELRKCKETQAEAMKNKGSRAPKPPKG